MRPPRDRAAQHALGELAGGRFRTPADDPVELVGEQLHHVPDFVQSTGGSDGTCCCLLLGSLRIARVTRARRASASAVYGSPGNAVASMPNPCNNSSAV